jgi:hypothetical protein
MQNTKETNRQVEPQKGKMKVCWSGIKHQQAAKKHGGRVYEMVVAELKYK